MGKGVRMTLQQIKPELLEEWKKEGEILVIFRCEQCYKKIPFYKTDDELIDMIYLTWVRDHKYCNRCEDKKKGNSKLKKEKPPRINRLLEKYEFQYFDEEDDL